MWIAKPIKALSSDEAFFFQQISEEKNFPLSQTLEWGKAGEAAGVQPFIAFETEKKIGGLAFDINHEMICTNGPYLNWSKDIINEELATFVYALTQAQKSIKKVVIKPRWYKKDEVDFSSFLKFPIHSFESSATKIISVPQYSKLDETLGTKIRHELSRVEKFQDKLTIYTPELSHFYQGLKRHNDKRGDYLPPFSWFQALEKATLFGMKLDNLIQTEILVACHNQSANYLYAYEDRTENSPNISLNLALQKDILIFCDKKKIRKYDLGGYKLNIDEDDSYWGVKQFKDKLPGEIIEYLSPVFIFE
ncbi:MAG: hypothetical protein ACOYL6_03890 [Bacteriovoracaceae bacterium]